MEMATIYTLTQQNNQYVELDGLCDGTTQNNTPPTYFNNATGTLKVLDPNGNAVVIGAAGATSLSIVYVAASNGNYRALITSAFNPPLGSGYKIVVDLTAPGGAVGHWELPATVAARKV
jgi:hypothetical protein